VLVFWIIFNVFVLAMLALDLGLLSRRPHRIGFREALAWSGIWIALAFLFAVLEFFWHGRTEALQFVTAYVIELSLSVDNLFVFLLIFRYFKVQGEHEHKVLFWGIIGALLVRGVFIAAGVGLIRHFQWITYAFGAFLVYSGIRLLTQGGAQVHPEKNLFVRGLRRLIPVTDDYVGGRFFIRQDGRRTGVSALRGWAATPLFAVLLVVETSGACRNSERFYRLHFERLRHSRTALNVLCPGRDAWPVCLFALWTLDRAHPDRPQDAGIALHFDFHRVDARRRAFYAGSVGGCVGIESSIKDDLTKTI